MRKQRILKLGTVLAGIALAAQLTIAGCGEPDAEGSAPTVTPTPCTIVYDAQPSGAPLPPATQLTLCVEETTGTGPK